MSPNLTPFVRIEAEYRARDVGDRLQNITPKMIKQDKKAPKLRCSGAQCRALIPICLDLAKEFLDPAKPVEEAALAGMINLDQCYRALSSGSIFCNDLLRTCSVDFALQYVALDKAHPGTLELEVLITIYCLRLLARREFEALLHIWCSISFSAGIKLWKIKPKLHLFLELCSVETTKPSLCWNYRDEDFGGSVARLARRRGGLLSARAFSQNLILMWSLQPMLRFV